MHSLQPSGLPRLPNKKGAMPASYSRRRRGPKPERRRALELLAASPDGCSEAIMLAHGFTVDFLVDLIRTGMATTDRARGRSRTRHGSRPREDHGGGAAGTRRASMALIQGRTLAAIEIVILLGTSSVGWTDGVRVSDHRARATRQIMLELLGEVPIAASLGGIRPIPAQIDRRRRRHSCGGHRACPLRHGSCALRRLDVEMRRAWF